jgi:hypothetical protein
MLLSCVIVLPKPGSVEMLMPSSVQSLATSHHAKKNIIYTFVPFLLSIIGLQAITIYFPSVGVVVL